MTPERPSVASDADHVARLHRLGLPLPSAKAYLALLELGETEARDVARASGLHIAKVYGAIDQLQRRGLATVILDSPRRYAPRPFDEYLRDLRRQREDELRALDAEREELLATFAIRGTLDVDDRGTFAMIRGRRATVKKLEHVISRARADLLVRATPSTPLAFPHVQGLIEAARARGVRVRLVLPRASDAAPPSGIEVQLAARLPASENALMLVSDDDVALCIHLLPDDGDARQGHDVGIVITHHALVLAMRDMLEGYATPRAVVAHANVPTRR